jgi:hypothetical protein
MSAQIIAEPPAKTRERLDRDAAAAQMKSNANIRMLRKHPIRPRKSLRRTILTLLHLS